YAPGPTDDETVARLVAEVDGPINVVVGQGGSATLERMAELGVRRISTGGSLFRATYAPIMAWGREMAEAGSFSYLDHMPGEKGMSKIIVR
ncbi:MAG: isocitrate lyase/phosphoenolpyruvate mutase family protein, partial [Rhodospirillaceae bacterium]|nr:isocitrate lyase/phosphoenolpyruvate mutase family protein [Rhodospirillaceae bacterium]